MEQSTEQQLVQRFTLATFLESVRLLDEGIASAEEIDIAMRAGAGLPEGPFHWADKRGLDVILDELAALEEAVGSRFRPPESLKNHVARGELGVKSGRGYLDH